MFIPASDYYADLASLISASEINSLGDIQRSYLIACMEQLPEWAQQTLHRRAKGEISSDAFVKIHNERYEEALAIARELIDSGILTANIRPLSCLLCRVNGGTEYSYDEILSRICREKLTKLQKPSKEAQQDFNEFLGICGGEQALALIDCEKLLAKRAYAGEMAFFHSTLTKHFPHSKDKSYIEALRDALRMLNGHAVTYGYRRLADKISQTIGSYFKMLPKDQSSTANVMQCRKAILFNELPIDASSKDIAWALNMTESEVRVKIPTAKAENVRSLLYLNCMKMDGLEDAACIAEDKGLHKLAEDIHTTLFNASLSV